MFIKRIKLSDFGRLSGIYEFLPDRCNVICQDNEYGKSTLVEAILCSFFNFPASGLRRGDLKPRDKHRPWFANNGAGYVVEIDLADLEGRKICLRSDFTRQQPFEMIDLDTHKSLPLEGMTFGRKFFRMPLQSFTECFFFRQDEREGSGRDELIAVIEEAVVSTRRSQDASIRAALIALSDCRLQFDEFSSAAITPDNLIKRVEERIAVQAGKLAELRQERERRAEEIAKAEKFDEEIRQLDRRLVALEHARIAAELRQIEALISRQDQLDATFKSKQERLRDLALYERYDPSWLARAETLYADWKSLRDQREAAEHEHGKQDMEPLCAVERELACFPASLGTMTRQDLDRLRSLQINFSSRKQEVVRHAAKRGELREELLLRGVPMQNYEPLQRRISQLPPEEEHMIYEYHLEHMGLEAAASGAERHAAETETGAAIARAQRDRLRTLSNVLFMAAVFCAAAGILFMLIDTTMAGAALLAASAITGAGGFFQHYRTQRHTTISLDPMVSRQVTASGDARRLRGQMDELETRFSRVAGGCSLDRDEIELLRLMAPWAHDVAAYHAAEQYLAGLRKTFDEICNDIAALLQFVSPDANADTIDEVEIAAAVDQMTRCLGAREKRDRLRENIERRTREIVRLDQELSARYRALDDLVSMTETSDAPLDIRLEAFRMGCENSLKYHALASEIGRTDLLTPANLAELRTRAEWCRSQLRQMQGTYPELVETPNPASSAAQLQHEIDNLKLRRNELSLRRVRAFNECDRAVEVWRREGPVHESEIQRLETMRDGLAEFREAVRIASVELSGIAEQVFAQWAAALNSRVNQILPGITNRYRDAEFSDDLELSLYSEEARRRLSAKELQHLSKGVRDQISLIVRVAISEHLSAHIGKLPLVFDEPFAHWDDTRFVEGVRFLAGLASSHQVILLSCHQWRYCELERRHPEIAASLNFCALTSHRQEMKDASADG